MIRPHLLTTLAVEVLPEGKPAGGGESDPVALDELGCSCPTAGAASLVRD